VRAAPAGRAFNDWLRTLIRATGFELDRTLETPSAPWDRRMLPVAEGDAVSVLVVDWAQGPIPGVTTVPFAPPMSMPIDLASAAAAYERYAVPKTGQIFYEAGGSQLPFQPAHGGSFQERRARAAPDRRGGKGPHGPGLARPKARREVRALARKHGLPRV
jgi:hypothetical protein